MKEKKRGRYKTPTEKIESYPHPELESAWKKTSGKINPAEMIERSGESIKFYPPDIPHTQIHTHPIKYPEDPYHRVGRGIHSPNDINKLLKDENIRTSVVAQINPKLKKVEGYTFVRKKGAYKYPLKQRKNLISKLKAGDFTYETFKKLLKSSNLQTRFVPAKGYEFNKAELIYQKKRPIRRYELGIIISIAFLTILLYSQKKFTGFVISAGRTYFSLLIFTLFMLLIGITFFLIRKKRKNKIIRLIENKL